jgi:osmotically-inducible protein OsmY
MMPGEARAKARRRRARGQRCAAAPRIEQALTADKGIDAAAVSMTVNKGGGPLNGTVPADQITRIDAMVREVAGVKIVINALRPIMPAS